MTLFEFLAGSAEACIVAPYLLVVADKGGIVSGLLRQQLRSGGLCLLLFTFALYAFGKIGGGDAKLAAASAVWMGWGPVIDYLLIASLLGGALALLILFGRTFALPLFMLKQPGIVNLHKPKGRIPYGVALGLAAVIVYPQTAIWIATQGM